MAKEKAVRELEDLPGIGEATAEKLRGAGIVSIEKVATAAPHEIAEIAGISVEAAKKAIAAAKGAVVVHFQSGEQFSEKRKAIGRITTGSSALDELIGGGVETNAITESYGKFSSGKSQLGFSIAVNVQLPKQSGGLDAGAIIIDTEGTFRPERIESIAKARGLDPREALSRITIARTSTTDEQVLAVERASELMEDGSIKLVIVDSLTSLFRAEFLGRAALGERQQKLNAHIHMLQTIADRHDAAAYVTNQVMDNPGILFGDPTTPIGGNVIAHAATTRLYMRKSKESKRIVRLVDSPNMPDGECVVRITEYGISD